MAKKNSSAFLFKKAIIVLGLILTIPLYAQTIKGVSSSSVLKASQQVQQTQESEKAESEDQDSKASKGLSILAPTKSSVTIPATPKGSRKAPSAPTIKPSTLKVPAVSRSRVSSSAFVGEIVGTLKKIKSDVFLYLNAKVRKIDVMVGKKKIASVRGTKRLDISKYIPSAKNGILNFIYYDMKNKQHKQSFDVKQYMVSEKDIRARETILVSRSRKSTEKPTNGRSRLESVAQTESEPEPESPAEPEVPEPSEPETTTTPDPDDGLRILGVDVIHTATQYRWVITVENNSDQALSGTMDVNGWQKSDSANSWSGAGGFRTSVPGPHQSIIQEVGWTRSPNSTMYKVNVEYDNQIVTEQDYVLAPLSLNIQNVQNVYNSGVTYTWTANLQNGGSYQLDNVKAEAFKQVGSSWQSAGVNTGLAIPAGSSSLSSTWNANGASRFKLVISVKQGQYSPYTELATLEQNFTAEHTAQDEATDTAAAQAAAAAIAAANSLHENLRQNISLTASLGQDGATYQWNISVNNGNNEAFVQEISGLVQQRVGSGSWQSGGEKLVGTLNPGESKSLPVGWTREFGATETRVQLMHNNTSFAQQSQSLTPITVDIQNLILTDMPDGSKQWQATINNPSDFDIFYVKVKSEKKGSTWVQASALQEGLMIAANGSLSVSGTYDPAGMNQFKLTVYAKKRNRYAPYEELGSLIQ